MNSFWRGFKEGFLMALSAWGKYWVASTAIIAVILILNIWIKA